MNYSKQHIESCGVDVELSKFSTPNEGVREYHAMLHVQSRGEGFQQQYARLCEAEKELLGTLGEAKVVLKRYFLSDATNQVPIIHQLSTANSQPSSFIQQPPLDGSKVALWIYLLEGAEVTYEHNMTVVRHNGYEHLWRMGLTTNEGDSYQQTRELLEQYNGELAKYDATLENNCVRTWFYTRDVDTRYAGLVKARREYFLEHGLTPETHYIASTGIGGVPADPKSIHQLGAYALTGESYRKEQQQYLYALSHLNRTIEYGVTFERGTLVHYGDRDQIFISGTASIDNKGEVLHVGDVVKQTERMWENVEALLAETGSGIQDVMQITVYLRDIADYERVSRMFSERMPKIPTIFTLAPVCRPTWLIEMECIAVRECCNAQFQNL